MTTLSKMIEKALSALSAIDADKFGRKAYAENFQTEAGVVTVSASQSRDKRVAARYAVTKVKSQLKLDGKVVSKDALAVALGETFVPAESAVMKASFMAKAPEMAADYAHYIRATFERVGKAFPQGVPTYPKLSSGFYEIIRTTLADACLATTSANHSEISKLVLDEPHLLKVAKKYGEQAALDWFHKTNAKLGDVDNASVEDSGSGEMYVIANRGEKVVRLLQQRILKSSPKGKLFHQFPARIYVDGKFTTEAAYKRMFAK